MKTFSLRVTTTAFLIFAMSAIINAQQNERSGSGFREVTRKAWIVNVYNCKTGYKKFESLHKSEADALKEKEYWERTDQGDTEPRGCNVKIIPTTITEYQIPPDPPIPPREDVAGQTAQPLKVPDNFDPADFIKDNQQRERHLDQLERIAQMSDPDKIAELLRDDPKPLENLAEDIQIYDQKFSYVERMQETARQEFLAKIANLMKPTGAAVTNNIAPSQPRSKPNRPAASSQKPGPVKGPCKIWISVGGSKKTLVAGIPYEKALKFVRIVRIKKSDYRPNMKIFIEDSTGRIVHEALAPSPF